MCVIGNKVDLREEKPEGSCVTTAHGEKLAMVRRPTTYIYMVLCSPVYCFYCKLVITCTNCPYWGLVDLGRVMCIVRSVSVSSVVCCSFLSVCEN